MSGELIEIDGSLLEGGGQILRIAATLSVLTRIPIRVTNIRAGRKKSGLMEQHLKGLELLNMICNGKLKGGFLGSSEIEFCPGKITGGNYYSVIKTAGSISLLLQVVLPCTLFANSDITLHLEGGTNAEMAPQIDYTTEVFRPILEKFGATFDFDLIRRGYFPKGGGKVVVNIKPVKQLKAVEMLDLGNLKALYGWSFVAGNLSVHLAESMANAAINKLRNVYQNIKIERYKEDPNIAPDNCSGIVIVAETTTGCVLGGSALGKRNEKPQQTGEKAADELLAPIQVGACVDEHLQDQLIVLMTIASGFSKIKVGDITLHTETAIYVAEKITNVKFDIIMKRNGAIIQCNGIGLNNY